MQIATGLRVEARHTLRIEGSRGVAGRSLLAVAPSLAIHPFLAKVSSDEFLEELRSREPFGRVPEVREVANGMVFLVRDFASYMTGELVSVSNQNA